MTIGRKAALLVVPVVGSWFFRLWYSTCRKRFHNREKLRDLLDGGKPIVGTCWHYCALGIFALAKEFPAVLMISASKDGEVLAKMTEHLGFSAVRGSSNRKGVRAAKELIREMRKGKNSGIVADGSQGPARIAQSGAIYIAARSGGTVLPMLYSVSRYFTFNSWDRLILPKPFSTINIFFGNPLPVPENVKADDLEDYRVRLENSLNELYEHAWQVYGKTEH
ncbi:lysophospholipid acyltransferase family protein [Desulfopila inferna]|uniref:lysophospholipid acyltransferase family protein n=1 Tax=Desulfopila inferna TaxID=468528 RepID=UPI0019669E6F|nr:lysophospholipid acyltransferase family protein [Desulfopila inferna]MBM9605833.1 lysophospholipid acyltransferase family protein [Desulfopila inferna]